MKKFYLIILFAFLASLGSYITAAETWTKVKDTANTLWTNLKDNTSNTISNLQTTLNTKWNELKEKSSETVLANSFVERGNYCHNEDVMIYRMHRFMMQGSGWLEKMAKFMFMFKGEMRRFTLLS